MSQQLLDYRSDTVTQPTAAMRRAMASAEVGDDVYAEDPTVNRLQDRVAELLGKEAALYMPSGSMTNQVAIRTHCRPGDSFLCEAEAHVFYYEQGAFAQLGGIVAQTVAGKHNMLRLEDLEDRVFGGGAHQVRTRLVTLENTHNRGAGAVQPYDELVRICEWAAESGLQRHLDGARLFNAVVATGIPARQWADHFDTVSICFSKGLGAPVGSCLAGSREFIAAAHRSRKCFGGAMRQAGIIAAGALHALENHVERLIDDHTHARRLADGIDQIDGLTLRPNCPQTNMVIFDVDASLGTAAELTSLLAARGIQMLPIAKRSVRAVTHMDVPPEGADIAAAVLAEAVEELRAEPVAAASHS